MLTPKEQEVLALVAKGYSNTQISQQLQISTNTTKTHLKSIFNKFKVQNRTEATVKYFNMYLDPISVSNNSEKGFNNPFRQ